MLLWIQLSCTSDAMLTGGGFRCERSSQCVLNDAIGTCESDGFCSFADSSCASGRSYFHYSGGQSGKCVAAASAGGAGELEQIDPAVTPDLGTGPDLARTDGPTPLIDAPDLGSLPSYNYMFVTSTNQAPSSFGGLDGADAICQTRATEAKLPGHYRAWLSSSTVDVRDRFPGARGWIRTDGRPFVDQLTDLFEPFPKTFSPPCVDELGNAVTGNVATGSYPNGTAKPGQTAGDWLSSTSPVTYGSCNFTRSEWMSYGSVNAGDVVQRIYCFGTDFYRPLAPNESGRIAFLSTSTLVPGNGVVTGLSNADAICGNDAAANSLPGTYRALLSTTQMPATARFNEGAPWVRTDGVVWVDSLADLIAGNVHTTLEVGPDRVHRGQYVWTGTGRPGDVGYFTCNDWQSQDGSAYGTEGLVYATGPEAFDFIAFGCSVPRPVYCLQQ